MEELDSNTENISKNNERAYATGKRKNSIARVWIKKGTGEISVNGKLCENLPRMHGGWEEVWPEGKKKLRSA